MKWYQLEKMLLEKKHYVFSFREFQRLRKGSPISNKKILQRYLEKGFIARLKKGLYVLLRHRPPHLIIANKLYQPSYISFDFALAHHHIIPETVYTITSATTKPTRQFEALQLSFTYQTIKRSAYTGYGPINHEGQTILMATPEKALADTLYFVSLKKHPPLDRIDLKDIRRKIFFAYLKLFNKKKLVEMGRALF